MNKLIADENNGVFDKSFQLNWNLYKNSIILTNEIGVKIVPLKLFSISEI
jgi:adenosyl cobinamide kinase/adenosyl cobinamide phosphate guanylyltransferase